MRTSDYGALPGSMSNVAARTDFATALAGSPADRDIVSQTYFKGLRCVQSDGYVKSKGGYVEDSQAESVPLCYGQPNDCTFVDFYSNARNWNHTFRKIYNSALTLLRCGDVTFADLRSRFVYLFVDKEGKCRQPQPGRSAELDSIHGHWRSAYARQPWEESMSVILAQDLDHDVRKLSGFLFRNAYHIYADELDAFARWMGWSN